MIGSVLGALLPEPERGAILRRWGGDPARASGLLGALEFVVGVGLVHASASAYLRAAADRLATDFLALAERSPVTSEQALGATWGGAMLWLAWLLRPSSLALVSVPLVGLLRLISYLTVREPVAEPSVWAAVRAAGLVRRATLGARERAAFGAAGEPDEVEGDAGSDELVVLTARPRPEWSDAATIGIGERFYRVAERDEVVRGGRRRHRHRLVSAPEHEVIRRYLRYEPPARG